MRHCNTGGAILTHCLAVAWDDWVVALWDASLWDAVLGDAVLGDAVLWDAVLWVAVLWVAALWVWLQYCVVGGTRWSGILLQQPPGCLSPQGWPRALRGLLFYDCCLPHMQAVQHVDPEAGAALCPVM